MEVARAAMTRDSDTRARLAAIDRLLREALPPPGLVDQKDTLPQQPDVVALAGKLGLRVKRGPPSRAGKELAIPEFYSAREARVTVAIEAARKAVEKVGLQCSSIGDKHECPSDEVCQLAEDARSNPETLDRIAAAMLMPTKNFTYWAGKFDWKDGPLANSYGVPLEFARLRIKDVRPSPEISHRD